MQWNTQLGIRSETNVFTELIVLYKKHWLMILSLRLNRPFRMRPGVLARPGVPERRYHRVVPGGRELPSLPRHRPRPRKKKCFI